MIHASIYWYLLSAMERDFNLVQNFKVTELSEIYVTILQGYNIAHTIVFVFNGYYSPIN